jgi:hypothetical protein
MISAVNVTGELSRSSRVLAQDPPARSCRMCPVALTATALRPVAMHAQLLLVRPLA